MNSRDFVYWLQGYFEVLQAADPESKSTPSLNPSQIDCIKRHLNMVFAHEIDPAMGTKEHQDVLKKLHAGNAQPASHFTQESAHTDQLQWPIADSESLRPRC